MPSSPGKPITFLVPGQEAPRQSGATRGAAGPPQATELGRGRIKHAVRLGTERGGGGEVQVTAVPGEEVVVLHIDGGPALTLHPETARDLLLAQSEVKRGRSAKDASNDEAGIGEVKVPVRLRWRGLEEGAATRGATRGFFGDVLLSGIDVITGLFTDKAADFAASQVVRRFDAQVDAGVYALQADELRKLKGNATPLSKVPAAADGAPLLVLVHGTFSSTHGTFSNLWTGHPQRVRSLFAHYGERVYALDHPTLGASPIANALTLAEALPKHARLHLVTHSRGGLVAEVLARACAGPNGDFKPFAAREYKDQREELRTLAALVKERDVRVDRIVRVACPARGTLLASKRLDAYVSVFKWTLKLAGIPVAPELLDFLGQVALRRADPGMLPGLAAQIPDSPLVRWLHAVDAPIAGELRVIAGDMEGDSVTSWLKTLLADAFYWTDNDLVVQTRSMYGGAPRAAGASFLLDQGGGVSHFGYFENERSAEAIVHALVQADPQGFRAVGPLSWAGKSSGGARGRARGPVDTKLASEKPAVFVLPGIFGSHLKVGDERIWLSWRLTQGLERLKYQPGVPDRVEPDEPIGVFYDDLCVFLAHTHEVIEFAFDWRRPIEDEARRLAAAVDAALLAREKSGQPVRILAHSMGGIVARTMQLERPAVWRRMMAHSGARLLMLGTPNGGTWAPMQVLSGDETFGNTLEGVGAPFQDHAARELIAQFPGILQLQAGLLDKKLGLGQHETWKKMADVDLQSVRERALWHDARAQLDAYRWGVPSQEVLDLAVALRKRLDAQRDGDLGKFADKLVLVVGKARATPDGFEQAGGELMYLDALEDGDGRTTLESALLPGVRTWRLECPHGNLPSRKDAFGAYVELLNDGATDLLTPLRASVAARGALAPASAHVRSRPARTRATAAPPESEGELYSVDGRQSFGGRAAHGRALRITVENGDLTFVPQPLLLGHYRSSRLTGTESVMNRLVGGAMEDSLKIELYPDLPGTHQVFVNTHADPTNPWQLPRPESVIVVGLGEEGNLRPSDLAHTVRQAVIAWAQRMAERPGGGPVHFELAATLIGSGGVGIAVGQSAQLVAQGVREANERLADRKWPLVSHLHLIELYLDRATEAWRALQLQAAASTGQYVVTATVQPGAGSLRRPLDSGYRGADYDFITAVTQKGEQGDSLIAYTLDTKRARTELRAQATQGGLMRELVAGASNDKNDDTRIGRTLFKLLVPVEMEPFFGGTTEMVLELDGGTAGIPWELLDTNTGAGGDPRPWAIRAKLLRKLRTEDFRAHVADADADASILVIGEPECDPKHYARLPGARDEARAVVERLTGPSALGSDKVKALISPDDPRQFGADARAVINALHERDWRIVHVAGHGEPPEKDGDPRGVVLSKCTFLGPREIRAMRVVPELVFVNCCHLAARDTGQLLGAPRDRVRFAAGVAEELIKIGVHCVIAAGWAVDDDAANAFATTFYEALLRGCRFIDSVAEARDVAFAFGGNTWAAYQCYGDPDWTFRREGADPQRPVKPLAEEFGGVASPSALRLALETLAVQSKYQKKPAEEQRGKIRHLEARFAKQWGGMGEVAEAFAVAWAAVGDATTAISWYEKALAANDGGASIKATEQLGNLRARVAWATVEKALKQSDERKKPRGAKAAAADGKLRAVLKTARSAIEDAVALLDRVVALQPSMERESLCASAYKRLALIEAAAGRPEEEAQAIAAMQQHYERAEALGREGQLPDFFYPALNRIAAELVLNAGQEKWKGLDSAAVAAVRQSLTTKVRDDPDFWSVVGETELSLYEALASGDLAKKLGSIDEGYADLHARVSAKWMWASVRDQLRFVLPKYAQGASPAERKAAQALLARLEEMAGATG